MIPSKLCIFCFRNDTEVEFTREHIIPKNIGGTLLIDDVCRICNSRLGENLDVEILKHLGIIKAFDSLEIKYDRAGILKNYYKITGHSNNIELPFTFINGEYKMLPQNQLDGSLILPEEDYEKILRKSVYRDKILKSIKMPQNNIETEIKKISKDYSKSDVGEIINAPRIGRSLKKRRDKFKIKIEPKSQSQIDRLLAKIFYEFLFLIGGKIIFKKAKELEPVYDFINTGKKSDLIFISNINTEKESYVPIHVIQFIFDYSYQKMRIGFFGKIAYEFTYIGLRYKDFWEELEEKFSVKNIIGIHYEQHLYRKTRNFWFISDDGSIVSWKK
jgi:hypothetical protein